MHLFRNIPISKGLLPVPIFFLCITYSIAEFVADPPFYAQIYVGDTIRLPRQLETDPFGDIIVSTRDQTSQIFLLYELPNNGSIEVVQLLLLDAPASKFGHGLVYHSGFLYVSNSSHIFRWPYTPGERIPLQFEDGVVVVDRIPAEGIPGVAHFTRTLIFDREGRLYVSVGSGTDLDQDFVPDRAVIKRFSNLSQLPINYADGEIFATGVRNEVGLTFDHLDRLWGVENSANLLNRTDLGNNTWIGNPAEELNLFDGEVGTHYGYPHCFSSYDLPGWTPNTQLLFDRFLGNDSVHSDAWCANVTNNRPPALALPAHTAPLELKFYQDRVNCGISGAFPCSMVYSVFATFHSGSFLGQPTPLGNRLGLIRFNTLTMMPTGQIDETIVYEENLDDNNACAPNCFRPVGLAFDTKGHLLVSTDYGNKILKVTYGQPPPPISKRTIID